MKKVAAATRSLVWLAVGALIGLALAGWSLFDAPAKLAAGLPAEAMARVNRGLILRSDFRAQVEAMTGSPFDQSTPAQRQEVLAAMIDEELLVQRGIELGLPASNAEVRAALADAVRVQATAEVRAAVAPDDGLRAFHQRHAGRYVSSGRMQIRHLLLPAGASADLLPALREAAADTTRLERVEQQHRLQRLPPIENDELIDVAARRALGDPAYEVACRLASGQISEAWSSSDGQHVLVMLQRVAPQPLSFDAVRQQVAADQRREREARWCDRSSSCRPSPLSAPSCSRAPSRRRC